jgi:hypothetical protein
MVQILNVNLSGDETPAAKARRVRRLKWILLFPCMAICLVGAIVLARLSLFSFKSVQVAFAAFWIATIFCLAFWKSRAPCPRCRWDIYLQKTSFPLLATYIPARCPNCDLDLERRWAEYRNT